MGLWEWFQDPAHRNSVKRIHRWVADLFGRRSEWNGPADELADIRDYGAMLKEQIKEWEKELIEKGIEKGEE